MPKVPQRPLSLGEKLNLQRAQRKLMASGFGREMGTLDFATVTIQPSPANSKNGDTRTTTPPQKESNDHES